MNRTFAVARMQLINRQTFVWVPAIIIASAFIISWLIFAIIGQAMGGTPERGQGFNGASQAPMWYFFAIGIQALTYTFPFSQAMSVSRRTFFLGTTLVSAGAAALLATVYTVLRFPEEATGGWGVGSYMFGIAWVTDGPWYHGWVFFFAVSLLFFVFGFWAATIYKRFGPTVTTVSMIGLGLLVIGVIALITLQRWWGHVGAWLATQTSLSVGLLILALTAVIAASSYLTLRRATP